MHCLYICVSFFVSVYPSFYMSVCLSAYLLVCLSIYLHLCVCLSVCLPVFVRVLRCVSTYRRSPKAPDPRHGRWDLRPVLSSVRSSGATDSVAAQRHPHLWQTDHKGLHLRFRWDGMTSDPPLGHAIIVYLNTLYLTLFVFPTVPYALQSLLCNLTLLPMSPSNMLIGRSNRSMLRNRLPGA